MDTRLLRYPCSYMIYSPLFDGLTPHPDGWRAAVPARQVLDAGLDVICDKPVTENFAEARDASSRPSARAAAHAVARKPVDALRIVANGVNALVGPETGALVITHYQRLLNFIVPDMVHVLAGGRIVKEGGKELALELEEKGYDWVKAAGN